MTDAQDVPDEPGWSIYGGFGEGMPVPHLPADFWTLRKVPTGRTIPMKDPLYGRQLHLRVYQADTADGPVTFAMREVSNGVYLVAVPD